MKKLFFIALTIVVASCSQNDEPVTKKTEVKVTERMRLSETQAYRLVDLPLECIDLQYPNKLNQVISGPEDLQSPRRLHPAFYGCFDWHSAVHGHWSLVRLAKKFPELDEKFKIADGLLGHISEENIRGELSYFDHPMSTGFERMYGWAWLLKLSEEIHTWEHPKAKELERNLQPLTNLIVDKVKEFLPELHYPIRVGTHTNTAFAMTMIYDFAETTGNDELKAAVTKRAKEFFMDDAGCPLGWEPGGYDFLSPCLEEADIMRRVLNKEQFKEWLLAFLPQLSDHDFELKPGIVANRADGHLVHLDGLNYSRAWCLYGIAETLPEEYGHLIQIANDHINHSLPDLTDGNYAGGHWLASFALMALTD